MEKVEDMLKDLRLSEAERKGVKLGWSDGKKAGVVAVQALGKLLSEKPAHVEGLEDSLGRVWCPLKGTDCKVMRDNLFMFTFKQESGKRKALLEGPWKVGNDLLVMEDFDPEKSLDEYEFGTTPIWVRVLKLPLGMMNRKTGERLGNQIGEYMDVDVGEDDMAAGEYLRIKVRINLANPIMRGVTVQLGDNRRERLCPLEFEFLPKFCFTCGIIGHEDKACKIQLATGEKQQYGKWLIAYIPKRRNDNEKSKWGKISDAGGQWRSSSSGGRQLQLRSNTLSWRKDIDNRNQQVGSGTNMDNVLEHIQPRVTEQMNEMLSAEYTREEIKDALESIGDLKAPGPDGMPAVFYKRYWGTVGDTVVNEVLSMLQGGSIPEGWNETVVVLIPKVQNPESRGGWGAIGRDHEAKLIFAAAGSVKAAGEALHTEAEALIQAIRVAENMGIGRPIFVSDCMGLVQATNNTSYDMSPLGALFREAKPRRTCSGQSRALTPAFVVRHPVLCSRRSFVPCAARPLPVLLHVSLLRELDGVACEESARRLVAQMSLASERAWPVKQGVSGISGRSPWVGHGGGARYD
ncbi:hypothetical protein QYE76_012306 [Lolium multiflorum]|uniref:RNase H type-1 domain-containing protein n=1 Tax=Lolium multiflorum TaxID=4521 RepID=A0AAD8U1L4_LOLMU|nr:hypothetical protein QYE76_012306 [Lolium multiflorum]